MEGHSVEMIVMTDKPNNMKDHNNTIDNKKIKILE